MDRAIRSATIRENHRFDEPCDSQNRSVHITHKTAAQRIRVNEVQKQLDQWIASGEEIALATVVGVEGSAPRPIGSRFAMTRSGSMIGSVSGGCVESDVFERAQGVLKEHEAVLVKYGPAPPDGFEVGLNCDGEIEVLIEPFLPGSAWQALRAATAVARPVAMATCISPNEALAAQLVVALPIPAQGSGIDVTAEPLVSGGIDPGIDTELISLVLDRIRDRRSEVVELTSDAVSYRVFIKTFAPPQRLYVVGATNIALPLCRMAKEVGFEVTVIDPRTAYADVERFRDAHAVLHEWPVDVLDGASLDADAYVLTLTHDVKFDLPTLARALQSDVRYIGALGSRKTHAKRLDALREEGFGDEVLARIKTPVGLDLGGRSPEEIALAILAEMVATRYERSGESLSSQGSNREPSRDARNT